MICMQNEKTHQQSQSTEDADDGWAPWAWRCRWSCKPQGTPWPRQLQLQRRVEWWKVYGSYFGNYKEFFFCFVFLMTLPRFTMTGWWFQRCSYFHPYLGRWSNLTNIFQMAWNHQLDDNANVKNLLDSWFQAIFSRESVWSWKKDCMQGMSRWHVNG